MRKTIVYPAVFLSAILCYCAIQAITGFKIHDFEGKCALCHSNIPDKNTLREELAFTDSIDKLCDKCHTTDKNKSHPINLKLTVNTPLTAHLDKNGLLTCTTCHDIHKEEKTSNRSDLSGLLWGHLKGRAFCSLCHTNETTGANWQHQTAIPYAHSNGKLLQAADGAPLDKLSTECLSCHDGTISRFPQIAVKQGIWQHEKGESHPIGVDYPRSEEFTSPEALPKEIRLFDGTIGCLSCHEIYNKEYNMLAMNNRRSRLCLTCHKK